MADEESGSSPLEEKTDQTETKGEVETDEAVVGASGDSQEEKSTAEIEQADEKAGGEQAPTENIDASKEEGDNEQPEEKGVGEEGTATSEITNEPAEVEENNIDKEAKEDPDTSTAIGDNAPEPMEETSKEQEGGDAEILTENAVSPKEVEKKKEDVDSVEPEAEKVAERTESPEVNGTAMEVTPDEAPATENGIKNSENEGQEVTGVIFQFSEETVLYEFNIDGDDVIGEMSTSDIILADGTELKKKEEVANFIQLGDEIKVSVVKRDNLKEFTYDEEEEEVGEDGEVTYSTRTVQIQPQWTASGKGRIVSHSSSGGLSRSNLKDEDVLVLEDQLENMFDYEPDNDEDEDVLLIEDVKIDEDVETKSVAKAKPALPKPVAKAVPAKPAKVEEKIPDEVFRYKAKLVQIRKPNTTQDPLSRVTSCLLELVDGKYAGKTLSTSVGLMFMWGYNLAKANLNAVVKFGDSCQVDCMIQAQAKKEDDPSNEEVLVIKKCYIGPPVEKPIRPTNDKTFAVYLSSRGVDETGFLKWVYGQSPSKPYFPFVSDMYQGTIQDFARDSTTNLVIGLIVKDARQILKTTNEGALLPLKDETQQEQPAPPGMEEEHTDNFAPQTSQPPADANDWTALHHLQHCCTAQQSFQIIGDSTKVVMSDKKVEFLFDETTNFQASSEEMTAVYYSVGTLAFFLKCRGLKYGAYVARTEALGHKQYVKKEDSSAVFDFMFKSIVPSNMKLGDPMQADESGNEAVFKGRCSLFDESWKIGCNGEPNSFEQVYICNADFYVSKVNIGKCDPRLLVKIGDTVKCQVQEMSNAEKRKLKRLTGQNIENIAILAFVGSEKRPKSATLMSALAAEELGPFLAPMGWTIEEFDALKTFGVRPPKEVASAEDLKELVEQNQHAQVPMAVNLVKEVMKIPSADNPFVNSLLKTDDDVKVAVFISKILTTALVNRIQHNLKAKIQDHFATPQFVTEMKNQGSKIAAAETTLDKKEDKKFVANPIKPPPSTTTSKSNESLPEKLKKVEEKTKKESDEKIAATKSLSKSKAPIRDARKILNSYKESKKVDDNVDLPKMVDEWTPLEYLRHFSTKKKKIVTGERFIHFGRVKFLKSTRTNFQAEYGETDSRGDFPFYTIEQLYLAYLHKSLRHSKYLEKLRFLNKKHLSMNHRDRDAFIKYLDGTKTSNVKRFTRRDLNPEQYMDMIPAPSSSSVPAPVPAFAPAKPIMNKYSLDAMQKEEEQTLKARMQLHLLESQSRQAPPPITRQAPPSKPSRFDQMYHPTAAVPVIPNPQPFTPTVVMPQVQPPQNPYAVRMQYSPPRFDSRMRSRSPVRRFPDYDPSLPTAASPPRMSPTRRWPSPPPVPRRPSPISDIALRWNQQMASIGAPAVPDRSRYAESDALDRLAAQEAQREEERLRRDASKFKEVIDLVDSDDDEPGRPPPVRIPSPPILSQSWHSADPLRQAYERQRSAEQQRLAFHAPSSMVNQQRQSSSQYDYNPYGRY